MRIGDAAFEAVFNSDPTQLNFGLGPLYNNVSCASCHINDGRGKAPEPGEALQSLLLRMSIPGVGTAWRTPKGAPAFGGQLQPHSIFNKMPEADVNLVDGIPCRSYFLMEQRSPLRQNAKIYLNQSL